MKWITRIIGFLLLLIVVLVVSLFFLPADRIARIAAEQIKAQTGRDVTISGDVSLTLWPVLGVSAGGIEVANAEWSRQGAMFTAQNAVIGIDAKALLTGEIKITNIEAANPTIRLESRTDGRASWVFTDGSGDASITTEVAPDREAQAVSIQRLSVTNATLIYDAQGSDLVSYSGVDLSLDWPERLGAATIKATLRPAKQNVDVTARIERFAGLIAGQVQPFTATISTKGGSVSIDGRGSTAGDVAGKLALDISNTDAFLRSLGLAGADLPRGLGRSIKMTTDMTLTSDRRLALRDMVADLGGNQISGAADISLNGIPQINAQISAGALDLTGATQGDGASSPQSTGSGWSITKIDASGLASFNGEIGLRATSVDLGTFKLGQTRALIRNDRSRAVFELREIQAYDGTLSGEFVMNNRNGLSVGGKLFANSVAMQKLLSDGAGINRFTGQSDFEMSFLGSGSSVDAIMKSLSGKGALKMGQGTIEGIDLNSLLKSGKGSGGTTVFNALGASYVIKSGNLRNDNLLLSLQNYEARGKGRVGLGAQDIDYLMIPTALRANQGKGLAIPVAIKGPWASPRILPDLSAAIDLNLADKKEEIKTRAKEKLREKVEESLGVKTEDGQSVEDAAKDKLEDKLKKELFKIFD